MDGIDRQRRADPVEVLAGLLDAIDVRTHADAARFTVNERTRLDLLIVHAIAGMAIAPLFATVASSMNTPSWMALRQIPGNPYTMAAILFAGGLILFPATLLRARTWEMVGLGLIFCWYAAMATGFAAAVLWWIAAGLPPQTQPGLYPALVYAHLSTVMAVHMGTLRRLIRDGR